MSADLEAIAALETAKSLMMGGGTWTNAAGYTTDAALWIDRALSALRQAAPDGSSRASTSSPPNGDPEGKWVLVPREPTPEPLWAICQNSEINGEDCSHCPLWEDHPKFGRVRRGCIGIAINAYRAMLAAAPEPPASDRPLEGRDVVSLPSGTTHNPSPPPPQREG